MLTRASARYLLQHPWLLFLSLVGVALGVAVVVAVDLANASATRAFAASTDTVAGRATHQIVGAGGTLDAALYARLRGAGVRETAPVAEGSVVVRGRVMTLLGLDPLADAPFRAFTADGVELGLFMATPGTVFLSPPAAAALGVAPGDTLGVAREGQRYGLRVAALISPGDEGAARAMENLLVADVATAQQVLGLDGRLSRIDLMGDDVAARVRPLLPPGARIQRPEARTASLETMTRAFRLNLTALSFLALVVGTFLVYNTTTFSVVQRRALLGRLRAVGVLRAEVFRLVLGEALVVGVVGTAFGLLGGIVLGRGLVNMVGQTINDLYVSVAVRGGEIAPAALVKGALLGIGATLLAAFMPAREAARTRVMAVLQRSESEAGLRRALPRLTLAGAALMAACGVFLALPIPSLALSYAALLGVLLGFALVVPVFVMGFARAVQPVAGRVAGPLGRMAAGGLEANLSRVAVAVAALAVAVAATIGVGVMIGSFRETVVVWLEGALQADVYAQPPSLVARRGDASLTPAVVRALATTPGARASYTIRSLETETQYGSTHTIAISGGEVQEASYRLKRGQPESVWPRVRRGEAVLVSEPYAFRHGVGAGDTLWLETDRGRVARPIAGVFYDYGDDAGLVLMYRSLYETLYRDRGVSGMALYAAPGVSADTLVERARARVVGQQSVILRTNRGLREFSMGIFDRTFAITGVLRLLALVVAFVGVLSALMALQLERGRELATLRAQGLTPGELWRLVTAQTGLMGLAAGLLSLPLGLVLAGVLVYVINRRSFGWTLQFSISPGILAGAVALAVAAALLAGLYPSWKMAGANPARALREE